MRKVEIVPVYPASSGGKVFVSLMKTTVDFRLSPSSTSEPTHYCYQQFIKVDSLGLPASIPNRIISWYIIACAHAHSSKDDMFIHFPVRLMDQLSGRTTAKKIQSGQF
jgi:hypothetical protein